jgi:hypothetical protein
MDMQLTSQQNALNDEFRAFADAEIVPFAQQFDQQENVPRSLINKMAQKKYLASFLPEDIGGMGADMTVFGLLNEQIGRGCSSVRSLITVHSMVCYGIARWGSALHKETLLPRLATGELLGAFALTEPNIGSDARNIETTAVKQGNYYILNGQKKWITFAQIADLFIIFAQYEGVPLAFLVDRHSAGLTIKPMHGVLGTRASMIAEIHMENCKVPVERCIGGKGFGFAGVALSALNVGRYSVAWGCVGLGQACLEASLDYSGKRQQFGESLDKHQLIRRMLTNMYTDVKAARLLCYHAGVKQNSNAVNATQETLVAKYFASTMVNRVASDAVQIHGGNGCSPDYAVSRLYRDAKVMEIIEGSSEMQQIMIAKYASQQYAMEKRKKAA